VDITTSIWGKEITSVLCDKTHRMPNSIIFTDINRSYMLFVVDASMWQISQMTCFEFALWQLCVKVPSKRLPCVTPFEKQSLSEVKQAIIQTQH
jgi:hypothetical protein